MMKKTFKYIQISLLAIALPVFTFAQQGGSKIDNPIQSSDLMGFINSIIDNGLLPLGAVVAVVAMIFAGFMFVTAAGDETKIKTAKNILLYTAIGIAILFGAKVIAKVIENTIKGIK